MHPADTSPTAPANKSRLGTPVKVFTKILTSFFIFGLLALGSSAARAASVATDAADYPPGATVNITGAGFLAGETVTLQVIHDDGDPLNGSGHEPWNVIADGFGGFNTFWVVPLDDNVGEVLRVNATGLTSALSATTTFLDANSVLTLTSVPDTPTAGSPFSVTANLVQPCGGDPDAPLVGRKVLFFLTEGNCGVDVGQQADDSGITDAFGNATGTLTITQSGSFGVRAKFLGEDKPDPCPTPGNSACDPNDPNSSERCQKISASNECQSFIGVGNEPPVVSCPSADTTLFCTLPPTQICIKSFTSSDPNGNLASCSVSLGTLSGDSVCFTPPDTGVFEIIFTCIDSLGASTSCTTKVIANLNLEPKVQTDSGLVLLGLCQADSILIGDVQAGGDGTGEEPGDTVTLELLFGSVVFSTIVAPRIEKDLIFTPDTAGIYTIIFKVTDICGLMDTDTLTIAFNVPGPADIIITSNDPPLATCPANSSLVVCDLSPICLPGFSCFDSDGNLATTTVIGGTLSGDTVCFTPVIGLNTLTLICVDSCGAADTCITTVTVSLAPPPTITCPPDLTIQCDVSSSPANTGSATGTASCGPPPTIAHSDSVVAGVCANSFTILRTWTATDSIGQVTSCVQTITVEDTTAPIITCPANITIECGSGSATGSATATDNCDPNPSVSSVDSVVLGACPGDTTIYRKWTATDACNNTNSCTQIITIKDTTPPTITCPANITIECGSGAATGSATATDICDPNPIIIFTDVVTPGACPADTTITRTWKAADCSGNADSCVQIITIQDVTPPTITCPANLTIECGSSSAPSATGSATAADVCDPNPTITFTDVVTGNSCIGDSLITRTFKATDCSGNADSCVQLISVKDTTPPVITCPANLTIECGASSAPSATGSATATDVCDPNPTITFTDVVSGSSCVGDSLITRTFKAADCSGNADSCVQLISVKDTTPPTITCPANITIECGSGAATGSATATDICDPNPIIIFTDVVTPGACPADTTLTRTWKVTDCSGNAASCVQIITIKDLTPPTITCPANLTIECGASSAPSATGSATATDVCDPNPAITFTDVVSGSSCVGDSLITRTWKATDCSGNADSCVQLISVKDTTPPTITCPANLTIECGSGSATGSATATDICDPNPVISFTDVVTPGACPADTTITRTWKATDCSGNSSSCIQTITIRDTTPPVITCPVNITLECGAPRDPAVTGSATATDNCDPNPTITFSDVVVGQSPNDTTVTRTWVVTDCSGNSDSCVQIITVRCEVVKTCIALTQTNRADDGSLLPGDQHTPQGAHERIYIVHEAGSSQIGGFDFLIAYDNSALSFTGASEGNVYSDYEWEFFTFRFGSSGNCSGGCPSGKLRVLGLANQSDGGHVPLTYTLQAGDTLACLDFLVSNDRTLECQFIPIRFCWLDCGDNVLSDKTGDTLSISCEVFDYQGTGSLGPEGNRAKITDVNANFPTFFGAPSADCEVSGGPGKPSTERKVNYKNGGIKIACADSIDARGDLNLNGLSNEIADAVLYTKYFINGISAFTLAPQGQIAASDVNADGLPLTVADLVYLIRVIVGDALPVPKLAHNSLSVEFDYAGGVFSTSHALGAALFVFDGQAEIDLLQSQVELTIGYREGRTYALIAPSMESRSIGEYIQAGELIATDAPLLSIEASDYDGAMVETLSRVVMPGEFELHQNYPNPFNPSTKFSFELPVQTAYTLNVFNVSGQLVAKFSGVGVGPVEVEWNAASVASGIYFYKLSAGKFTSTRKALLLK